MARLPRYVLPGQPQHVIQRGNNRCPVFHDDNDYRWFHHYLHQASVRAGCHIHAYVFMTNHIHLLLTPDTDTSIAKTMQSVGGRYVRFFNTKYRRTGTLWEGRYRATLIDTENYLFTCSRYIELNPVRAGIVTQPGDYPWSSYHANALGKRDPLVVPHQRYLALDNDSQRRQSAYRGLFSRHIDDRSLKDIRYATQKGWALGSDGFKNAIEQKLARRSRPLPRGGNRRSGEFHNEPTRKQYE